MEVSRNFRPAEGFLEEIRDVCTQRGLVLIFDECTSGFRETLGGLHLKYGVNPDIAVFGKALGNGYPITAVIGTQDVMNAARKTFISSTFWTDRIGPAAALKTLEIYERDRVWEQLTATGQAVIDIWNDISQKNSVPISISGLPALASFTFDTHNQFFRTLLAERMLSSGVLASTSFFSSTCHSTKELSYYHDILDSIFSEISGLLSDQSLINNYKLTPAVSSFQRLN